MSILRASPFKLDWSTFLAEQWCVSNDLRAYPARQPETDQAIPPGLWGGVDERGYDKEHKRENQQNQGQHLENSFHLSGYAQRKGRGGWPPGLGKSISTLTKVPQCTTAFVHLSACGSTLRGMNPADFQPEYDSSVVEYILNPPPDSPNASIPINPAYCLTLASAAIMSGFFAPLLVAVVLRPPIAQAPASPFKFNKPVPWLLFPNGVTRNAGQLASYWGMPGVPRDQALDYAKLDVDSPVEGQ